MYRFVEKEKEIRKEQKGYNFLKKVMAFFDIPHTFYQYISISDFPQHLATVTDVDRQRT